MGGDEASGAGHGAAAAAVEAAEVCRRRVDKGLAVGGDHGHVAGGDLLDALNDVPVGEVHVLGVVLETQRRRRLAQQLRRADNDLSKKKFKGGFRGCANFFNPAAHSSLSLSLSLLFPSIILFSSS